MRKNVDLRLTETITFITGKAPAGITAGEHTNIVAALTHWNTNTLLANRQKVSKLMSQEGVANRPDTKEDRSYRRASILVRCVLVDTAERDWPTAKKATNDNRAGHAARYATDMKAALVGLYKIDAYSAPKLRQLQDHPDVFLQAYRLKIHTAAEARRYPYHFYMTVDDTFTLSPSTAQRDGTEVLALNIPVIPFASVSGNLGALVGTLSTVDNGFDLILTTELSACCFCFTVTGGVMAAVHIQPPANKNDVTMGSLENTSGSTLATRMRTDGAFANGPGGFKVYGMRSIWNSDAASNEAGYGYPEGARTTILAVRNSGTWHVYSQITRGVDRIVQRIDNR
jgi:hypothetical protein